MFPIPRSARVAALLLLASLTGCGGGGDGSPVDTRAVSEATLGPGGGSLASPDGLLTLSIPAGALAADTTLSIERLAGDGAELHIYEMLPEGLQFAVPATLQADVTTMLSSSSAARFELKSLPLIATTTPGSETLEALDDLTLTADADAGTLTLRGALSHFSRFAVGGNIQAAAGIEGVPEFWPANTPFGPVRIVLERNDQPGLLGETVEFATFIDSSEAPVIPGSPNPSFLQPLPAASSTALYDLQYACGDPGVGVFRGTLSFLGARREFALVTTPEEVDIANALLFGITGAPISGGELRSVVRTIAERYTLVGVRRVSCGGSSPIDDGGGDSTGGGGGVDAGGDSGSGGGDAPTIATATAQVSIDHVIGTTVCPTPAEPIVVTHDGSGSLDISVTEALDFLTVTPTSTSAGASGASFTPAFPCSGFSLGANTGVLSITASDPASGMASNTLQIPVTVTVRQ